MKLIGEKELIRRLDAIHEVEVPTGQAWADATAAYARRHVPVDTGKLQASIRARKTTKGGRSKVVARGTISFVDPGSKAHHEAAKKRKAMRYGSEGAIHFAKKVNHPATANTHIRIRSAEAGLQVNPFTRALLKLWNGAA